MEATTHVKQATGAQPARAHDLDSLARLDVEALGEVYARGPVPRDLGALEGHPRGRMLAVRALDHGPLFAALRRFAGGAAFPWGGKTFRGRGETGTGVNRVHLFGRHQLFPFRTRFEASAVDGKPCIALDYRLADNPALIRAIHDEIREVAPGLFLGPAMWQPKKDATLVLWFALDTRIQAEPVGGVA